MGPKKIPQNSRQISLPKIKKKNHRRASAGAQGEKNVGRINLVIFSAGGGTANLGVPRDIRSNLNKMMSLL